MPWDGSPHAGFSTGEPWLEIQVPADGTAAEQQTDPGSMFAWYRELIALRRRLRGNVELVDTHPGVVSFRREKHVITLNFSDTPQPPPPGGELVLATPASDLVELEPGGAIVATA
jgi:glycosidase